jgi:hypothetical protein
MHPGTPLNALFVGTGRDGTLSITRMVDEIFAARGGGQRAMHEYQAREFYDAFCNLRETGEPRFANDIRSMIDACPYNVIVGNGYAGILAEFAAACGGRATLVHIKRRDRAACVQSLMRNSELFPHAYGYYTSDPAATVKRMAAFHFGEMTREAWDRLPCEARFGWFYDKTHALIAAAAPLFAGYAEIATEDLETEAARRLIARIVAGEEGMIPGPARLNAHRIDITTLPADRRPRMQWLMGQLNLHRLAHDEAYAVEYFLEKFVAWTGYQIGGEIGAISPEDVRDRAELTTILERAEQALRRGLRDVEALRRANEA